MSTRKIVIGVIGGARVAQESLDLAHEVGALIAQRDALLVCGGLGGVMEAAAKGAAENGGTVVGILPSESRQDANPYVTIAIPTGMGISRNMLVVRAADAIIAFPGSYGTLSEIALALNLGKTVVYLPGAWDLRKIEAVPTSQFKEAFNAAQAVGLALDAVR
jgi:uncharacterized protein (TIGR00725 family)